MVNNISKYIATRLLPCIAALLVLTASPAFAIDEEKCAERGEYYNDNRDKCEKEFCKDDNYNNNNLKNCQRIVYNIKYDPSPDSNECACRNKVREINIGLFRFLKWTETAGNASNGFNPAIKVTYKTQGLFVNWYEISGDHSASLKHGECDWLYGLRFCARNAWPVGLKVMSENQDLTKPAHGYEGLYNDDSCYRDKGGTCNRPKKEQVRLCAYEDSMDGMDTDSKHNPFHKQYPRVSDMGKAVADGAASGTALGGILGTFVPGVGTVIGAIVGAIFGPLIALIMSTYNHVVIMSLGCVDLPLLPPPPPYCSTLVNPPPRPQVVNVSNLRSGATQINNPSELQKAESLQQPLASFAGSYPEKAYQDLTNTKNPDNWRYQSNVDWFYPKIGIILGDYSYRTDPDDATHEIADPDLVKTAVIRVDMYNRANNSVTLEIPLDGDAGSTVRYTVAAETLDDKVCAYITASPYMSPGEEPELIDCVDRPITYKKKNNTYASAPPLPQVFQPTDGTSNAENPKLWVWLRDDPRITANVDYDSYPIDGTDKAAFFNSVQSSAVFVPLNGCDTPDPLQFGADKPMGKVANLTHRLYGYPYCIARQDNNRNGILEYNERDLCVNNLPPDKLGKVLELMTPTSTYYNVINADFNPQTAIEGECSKSLSSAVAEPDGSVTYNIVDNDSCKYDDKGEDIGMRRYAPDALRGELVVERDGKQVLLRRANAPTKVIVKPYVDYTGGAAPVPTYGECRYELQSDNQLKEMCESSGRFRYPPDMYRGESIRAKAALETPDSRSYCVRVADIMCPLEYPSDGSDNVEYWSRSPAYPTDQAAAMPGTGKCKPGYGVALDTQMTLNNGALPPWVMIDPDKKPERQCIAATGNAINLAGSWGNVTKGCVQIQCNPQGGVGAVFALTDITFTAKTGSNCDATCTYKCDNPPTVQAGTNNVVVQNCQKVSCSGPGVNPAGSMNLAVDCNKYGQYSNWRPQTVCTMQ